MRQLKTNQLNRTFVSEKKRIDTSCRKATQPTSFKIYCAGPLFNNKEKEEMQEIADALEEAGYNVFLPQRDGFEFFNLLPAFDRLKISQEAARQILNKAIFALDVFHVIESQGLVLNINGRVPDEGAMVEAGIAWNCGKKVVIYKNDARSLIHGNDNPLLLGLSDFKVISEVNELPLAFNELRSRVTRSKPIIDTSAVSNFYKKGRAVASLAQNRSNGDVSAMCKRLMEVLKDE